MRVILCNIDTSTVNLVFLSQMCHFMSDAHVKLLLSNLLAGLSVADHVRHIQSLVPDV